MGEPHTHDHVAPNGEETDPVNRSVTDSLRISFAVLKWIMIALVVAFLFSGWFNVSEGQVAIRLRFGALKQEASGQVLGPGGPYFALPEPLDEVIFVSTGERRVSIERAFWFEVKEGDALKSLDEQQGDVSGLDPAKNGYLLTGDKNIVHAKWNVTWGVAPEDAATFARSLSASSDEKRTERHAKKIVRAVAEQALVRLAAGVTADELISGNIERATVEARKHIQRALDRLQSGITVAGVLVSTKPTPPLVTRPAFNALNQAHGLRDRRIEVAREARARILNEAAGKAFPELLAAIDAYETARQSGDPAATKSSEAAINALLDGPKVGGMAKKILNEAGSDRTATVAAIQSEAETFRRLLPLYERSPNLVRKLRWEETLKEILTGDVETFYLPPGRKHIVLDLNRDPVIQAEKEAEQYRKESKKRRAATEPRQSAPAPKADSHEGHGH